MITAINIPSQNYYKTIHIKLIVGLIISFLIIGMFYNQFSNHKNKDKTEQNENKKSSGKNEKHINQQAKEQAKKNYENAKNEFDKIDKKTQKTSNDKKLWNKLRKQVKHWKNKMDNTGENHSQKAKGN